MKSFFNYAKNRILYNIFRFLFFLLIAFLLVTYKVNAKVIDYKFMGVTLNSTFNVNANSSKDSNVLFIVTEDSTEKYLVVDLCSTIGTNFNVSVPSDYDGSYTEYNKSYLLNETCSVNSYSGEKIRMFFNVSSYADAGNGNQAINNITRITNLNSYTGVFKLISMGLSDTIDLGDLTINNQNSIINDINSLQSDLNNLGGSLNDIESNINSNINDVENSINNNITNAFNNCASSGTNYLNNVTSWSNGYINTSGSVSSSSTDLLTDFIILNSDVDVVIDTNREFINIGYAFYDSNKNFISKKDNNLVSSILLSNLNSNIRYIRIWFNYNNSSLNSNQLINEYGASFGVSSCKNKLDSLNDTQKETNDKLDEANKTSKGIWDTLKSLPETIINGFLDLLISVFVPEESFFENWFLQVKLMFEEQLGFLATPFTIIIEFIQRFTELSSSSDIIIDIPDIKVPNFENATLIKATTFNWSSLLNSKDSLKNLWTLYLDFIDVFLILNFIGLCSSIYARIFGGDTSNYEYYTVEDTYTVNDSTGEVTNHRLNQRTTKRKKVN